LKFFIDSANLDEIREVHSWGILAGVTTNPSLVAREGRSFRDLIREIASLVEGPVSAEVVSTDADGMIREGLEYASWAPNVVIKTPLTAEGLKATRALSQRGVRVNMTLIFTANQALLAARAGASFVSPCVGRLDDIGHDGMAVVREVAEIFRRHQLPTEIIAASIRHPLHITQAALAGAHIATAPFKVLKQLLTHPLTEQGLQRFLADWEKAQAAMGAQAALGAGAAMGADARAR